jgi:hypothetical protein
MKPMQPRSAETDYLFACLRIRLSAPEHVEQTPHVPKGLDWAKLLELAQEHKVLGIVYPLLAPLEIDDIRAAWRSEWVSSQLLVAELESLLLRFASGGLDVIPLKGPVLSEALYGDAAARQSADLDLLVREEDFAAAQSLLLSSGCTAGTGPGTGYHWIFFHEGTTVELHTHLGPRHLDPFETRDVWSQSLPDVYRGQPIRRLSDGDLVLFLSFHLLKHNCTRLLWAADLGRALLLEQRRGAGDSLLEAARAQGLEDMLFAGAALARAALGTPMPAALDAAIALRPRLDASARDFVEWMFADWGGERRKPEIWNYWLGVERSAWRRWRTRIALLRPIEADRRWAEMRGLPIPQLPLWRALRLLSKHGIARGWRAFLQALSR